MDIAFLVSLIVKVEYTPLGSDTKVLSTLFEIVCKQVVVKYAKTNDLVVKESDKQNHYPNFTLMKNKSDKDKIAIDVKTTYTEKEDQRFGFTLGSYTSYIHPKKEKKNIIYPYSEYVESLEGAYILKCQK